MAETPDIEELVLSSLESRQSLADVLTALQCFKDFSNLSTQLNALQTVLVNLPRVAAFQDTKFDSVKHLLQSTCNFCVNIKNDLKEKAQSESTDWSSLECLGYNVDSLTQRLQLYTSCLAIGAIHAASSTGHLLFTREAEAEFRELISDAVAAAERNLESAENRIMQLENRQDEAVDTIPKNLNCVGDEERD